MEELSLMLRVHGKHTLMFVCLFVFSSDCGLILGWILGEKIGMMSKEVVGGLWSQADWIQLPRTSPPSGTLLLGSCGRCVCGCLRFAGCLLAVVLRFVMTGVY